MSALREFVGPLLEEEEEGKIQKVTLEDREKVLRKVFENSKKFGTSARWHFGAEWEISDFEEVLPNLSSACLQGTWAVTDNGLTLERPGCHLVAGCGVSDSGAYVCDYFKEALYGLTLGLSDDVSFTRHASRGHGSEKCKDLFVPADAKHLVFGPLPTELQDTLKQVAELLSAQGIAIEFPGQSESILFYQWKIISGASCSDRSGLVSEILNDKIKYRGFDISTKDITPRAILGPGASAAAKEASPVKGLVKISSKRKIISPQK